MAATTEVVEEGNMEAEYRMMKKEGGIFARKRERAVDGSYLVVAGLEVRFA